MSVVQPTARPGVLLNLPDAVDHRRQLGEAINRLTQGHGNFTLFVTLDPNAAQTVVTDSRISIQTTFLMQPQTAHAAAAVPTTYVVCTTGSATVTHANNAQTDRLFTVAMIG